MTERILAILPLQTEHWSADNGPRKQQEAVKGQAMGTELRLYSHWRAWVQVLARLSNTNTSTCWEEAADGVHARVPATHRRPRLNSCLFDFGLAQFQL